MDALFNAILHSSVFVAPVRCVFCVAETREMKGTNCPVRMSFLVLDVSILRLLCNISIHST